MARLWMVALWLAGGIAWWGGFGPRWPGCTGIPAAVVLFWAWSVGLLAWLNWPSSPLNLGWAWLALGWLGGVVRAGTRRPARARMVWAACAGGSALLNHAWPLTAREAGEPGGLWLPTLTCGLAGAAFAETPFGAAYWALGCQLFGLGVNGEVGSRGLASALAATMLAFALRWVAAQAPAGLWDAVGLGRIRSGNRLNRYPDRRAEKGE
jgi:hypothetical protein